MSRLRELQLALTEAVFAGTYQAVADMLAPGGSALRSVALYRRLIRANYTQVLKVTYPVVSRLVGARDFGLLARGYLDAHPSTSGDLFAYGRHFPAFLHALPVDPLLAELARLEWACHEVCAAADSPPLSGEQLRSIVSADPARVRMRVHPASRLLQCSLPVHRVWRALQPDAPTNEPIDLPLPNEATGVVVTRDGGTVKVTPLAPLDYRLLEAMAAGASLAEIERMAVATDPEFDWSRFAASLLGLRVLSGWSLEDAPCACIRPG